MFNMERRQELHTITQQRILPLLAPTLLWPHTCEQLNLNAEAHSEHDKVRFPICSPGIFDGGRWGPSRRQQMGV